MELSPAVERVMALAQQFATEQGVDRLDLTHWLLALIEDEDGKPAVLFDRFGVPLLPLREALLQRDFVPESLAPGVDSLLASGREKAISLRGEPTLTTEFLLLAVVDANPTFREWFESFGLSLPALENHLRPDYMTTELTEELIHSSFMIADPPERMEALRIIDVNLNRARESLRILDDYARFVLNDRVLTESIKTLRHDLVEATERLNVPSLQSARDTPSDVGVDLGTVREYVRESPASVATVNFKRLQESLRSVEEYAKVLGGELSRSLEKIRYRTYALESVVTRGRTARDRLQNVQLYVLLTGSRCACTLDWTIAEAAEGGVQMVQLREKELSDRELLERAIRVRKWTEQAGLLFILNDRPDIAKLAGADGVHLGQDDLSVAAARRILGSDPLIGVSTHSVEQLRKAVLDGADYLGVGPTFPSKTKAFDHFPGLQLIQQANEETSLPSFALGGITLENLAQVRRAGASRIAISAPICESDEPRVIATQLRNALIARMT